MQRTPVTSWQVWTSLWIKLNTELCRGIFIDQPVQSSTDPGKPVHNCGKYTSAPLWGWLSTGALGVLSPHTPQPLCGNEHWLFRSPLTSPQLWLPGVPPQPAPELLFGSPQLCFQVVSPLGAFKRSLISSSCADKSVQHWVKSPAAD